MENKIFEGYSYRTSARFGSRVSVTIAGDKVSVIGPRIGQIIYSIWINSQALLMAIIGIALLASLVLLSWKYLLLALVLLIVHCAVGGFGAGCLWELTNLIAFGQGTRGETATFQLKEVKRVKIGRGWARNGLWLILLPYVAGINSAAEGLAVSFEVPDGKRSKNVVYAIHMKTKEEAGMLAKLLQNN